MLPVIVGASAAAVAVDEKCRPHQRGAAPQAEVALAAAANETAAPAIVDGAAAPQGRAVASAGASEQRMCETVAARPTDGRTKRVSHRLAAAASLLSIGDPKDDASPTEPVFSFGKWTHPCNLERAKVLVAMAS